MCESPRAKGCIKTLGSTARTLFVFCSPSRALFIPLFTRYGAAMADGTVVGPSQVALLVLSVEGFIDKYKVDMVACCPFYSFIVPVA